MWTIIKVLFGFSNFKSLLRKYDEQQISEWLDKSLVKENYELAAFLRYYIDFRFKKEYTHESTE